MTAILLIALFVFVFVILIPKGKLSDKAKIVKKKALKSLQDSEKAEKAENDKTEKQNNAYDDIFNSGTRI